MEAIGVIPARYHSTRFPGKVLADLGGKPVIEYVYKEALKSRRLDDILVATDDQRVVDAVKNFGGRSVVTSKNHQSGTDRIREVVNQIDARIVVNIQGDEPLIRASMIDDLVFCLLEDSKLVMATLIKEIKDSSEINDPNIVKVVKNEDNFALYFSRAAIPYIRDAESRQIPAQFYKHIGLYAYTKEFLFTFFHLPKSSLENLEKLEQLRVLESGYKIKLVETPFDVIGVDTPEDLEKVRQKLSGLNNG